MVAVLRSAGRAGAVILALLCTACLEVEPAPGFALGGAANEGAALGRCEDWLISRADGLKGRCEPIEVPLDWEAPHGRKISIPVFHLPATQKPTLAQLWMLDGGPGGTGLGLMDAGLVAYLRQLQIDVHIPSHRGTLDSGFTCDGAVAASEACAKQLADRWGSGLAHFNTVQAAHDLAAAIEATEPVQGAPRIVFGLSYGAYWAEHFAVLHPDLADGLVLDSPLPADVDLTKLFDDQRAGFISLIETCTSDSECASRVGFDDPEVFVAAVVAAVDAGDCGERDEGKWLEGKYPATLGKLGVHSGTREFVPYLLALLASCTPETMEVAEPLLDSLLEISRSDAGMPNAALAGWSTDSTPFGTAPLGLVVLQTSVLPAELDPSSELPVQESGAVRLGIAQRLADARTYYGDLPAVGRPEAFEYSLPTFVLVNPYDLQTPLATVERLGSRLAGEDHSLWVVPMAEHFVAASNMAGLKFCAGEQTSFFTKSLNVPGPASENLCIEEQGNLDPLLIRKDLRHKFHLVFPSVVDPWDLVPVP